MMKKIELRDVIANKCTLHLYSALTSKIPLYVYYLILFSQRLLRQVLLLLCFLWSNGS